MPEIGGFLYVMYFLNFYTVVNTAVHTRIPNLNIPKFGRRMRVWTLVATSVGSSRHSDYEDFGRIFWTLLYVPLHAHWSWAAQYREKVLCKILVTIYTIARQALHERMQQKPMSEDTRTMKILCGFFEQFWPLLCYVFCCMRTGAGLHSEPKRVLCKIHAAIYTIARRALRERMQ